MEQKIKDQSKEYLLRLADDRLILGHRLSEWCGHAPILEEDIALANIALDCIGQSQFLYDAASRLEGQNRPADDFVYRRDALEFRNLLLLEQPNGDFAQTIVRQFLYDAYGVLLFDALQSSTLEPLAGIAQKAVKELRYHVRHSGQWILRLGDGTEESRRRTQHALDLLWKYTDEFFLSDGLEKELAGHGVAVLSDSLKTAWRQTVTTVLTEATLTIPESGSFMHRGGRDGKHTEHLGHLLSELQIVARSYPDITW